MKFILFLIFFNVIINGNDHVLKLKQIYSNKIDSFSKSIQHDNLIIFTAPDCPSCIRQIKDLSCLDNLPIHLIAIRGTEKEIYKEYRKKKIKRDIYLGGKEAIAFFNLKNNHTPQILVRTHEKNISLKGYTKCSDLKKKFYR
jgi:hypothetical protein